MSYYIDGQTVRIIALLTDPSTGDPNDVATQTPIDDPTLVITAYKPDGTSTTSSAVRDATGTYHADFLVDQTGNWQFASTSTGAAANRGRLENRVYVAAIP